MGGARIEKINELIKRQLNEIILRELEFGPGVLVTIIRVETSKELDSCKVFVSVFPLAKTAQVMEYLQRKTKELQYLLNRKMTIRRTPDIIFKEDKVLEKIQRLDSLLSKVEKEEG